MDLKSFDENPYALPADIDIKIRELLGLSPEETPDLEIRLTKILRDFEFEQFYLQKNATAAEQKRALITFQKHAKALQSAFDRLDPMLLNQILRPIHVSSEQIHVDPIILMENISIIQSGIDNFLKENTAVKNRPADLALYKAVRELIQFFETNFGSDIKVSLDRQSYNNAKFNSAGAEALNMALRSSRFAPTAKAIANMIKKVLSETEKPRAQQGSLARRHWKIKD